MVDRQHALCALLDRVEADVGRDPVQPWAKRATALEPAESPPGPQQGLLQCVVGVLGRPEHAIAVGVKLAPVRLDELLERPLVPAARRSSRRALCAVGPGASTLMPTRLDAAGSARWFRLGGGSTDQNHPPTTEEQSDEQETDLDLLRLARRVVEAPQDWHFPYFNDEMTAAIGATMASSGAMLCGQVTYQEWAGFWPDADNEMAAFMNGRRSTSPPPRSTTSTGATRICSRRRARGRRGTQGAAGQGHRHVWKRHAGPLVASRASSTSCGSLIHPVVVGKGARLFENGDQHALALADSQTFDTGVVYATYRPAVRDEGDDR